MTGCLPAVADAMAQAARHRPAMMHGEEPDERALTEEMAVLLGQEAALFVPTCTMANQTALRLWWPPGSVVLAEQTAHVATVELEATALTAAIIRTGAGRNGRLMPDAVGRAMDGEGSCPNLVWRENTSMRAGETIMPDGWLTAISAKVQGTATRVHLDGSRLWNAAVGSGHSWKLSRTGPIPWLSA